MDKREKMVKLSWLKQEIDKLTAEYETLRSELLTEFGDEAISYAWARFSRWSRTSWKLKEWVQESELLASYPDYAKFDLTKFVKRNEVLWNQYAERTVSEFLTVKLLADDGQETSWVWE